ncbi:hypothetical protein RRG08_061523 [Elysia crispata]|uniref:Reverse transcriptase/retrotransposon-derived protein RNase H-like domain-containing protein n=1 Tax=Elysia crispata TaxID=231223 RepID=A0AAE1APJ1_9GAST|nr:hypothetical protein RRG08_061523 [Elysia crispata]
MEATKSRGKVITWTDECQTAFEAAKSSLASATLLNHPNPKSEMRLSTDASDSAIGAVLSQKHHGMWRPIAFFSRKLTSTQSRYSTFDQELLAIYSAIQHFRFFLEGALKLKEVNLDGCILLCDVSTSRPRPIVPPLWTKTIFEAIHNLSHPGHKPTTRENFRKLSPLSPVHHGTTKKYLPRDLMSAEQVYMRHDAHCGPLVRPYDGPFKVLYRSDKHFDILRNNKSTRVSIDRLKPAYSH